VREVIAALAPRHGLEVLTATSEDEYFPPPPHLRALLLALQSAVEGGCAARAPARPGPVEDDRSWDAARALELLEVG
jgi:hypothetical protein